MSIREQTFLDYDGFLDKSKPRKTTDDCYTPPNIYEAMCEALKKIHQMAIDLRNIIPHLDKRWEVHLKAAINIYQTAERAYLSPPRNCDVGTAEEQEVRFRNYCWNHSSRDKNMECQCPIDIEGKAGCKLAWAQMPYDESEVGE